MISITAYRGPTDAKLRSARNALNEELRKGGFTPIISEAIAAQSRALGVDDGTLKPSPDVNNYRVESVVDGEIYRYKRSIFGISLRAESFAYEESDPNPPHMVTVFHVHNAQAEKEAGMRFNELVSQHLLVELEEFQTLSEPARAFKSSSPTPVEAPSRQEVDAAHFLSVQVTKDLAIAIKSSNGGLLVSDLPKQVKARQKSQIDEAIKGLLAHGIIEQEYVIVCTQSNAVVARVPTPAAVQIIDEQNVKCSCGARMCEERLEEAVNVTALGRLLLDKSHWMTVLLVNELLRVGIDPKDIYTEQQSGGDEMDCIALMDGYLVLFELKDKEFNLGNAYSFSAKVGLIRPSRSVILTTAKVGTDARDHFERARLATRSRTRKSLVSRVVGDDGQPTYIEGMANLQKGIEALADGFARADALSLMETVLPFAGVSAQSFLEAFAGLSGDAAAQSASQ